jgi:hypothetical protein
MIALAVVCVVAVACAIFRIAHQRRSIGERIVDLLYSVAAVAAATAQAADAGLKRYREVRAEIRRSHLPAYVEVA